MITRSRSLIKLCIVLSLLFLSSCVKPPSGTPSNPTQVKESKLIQSPILDGNFGSINQLHSIDRVFSFSKSEDEEMSEVPSVSLSDSSVFNVVSKVGCEKPLAKGDRCFVRVRANAKLLNDQEAGVKSSVLTVGSVSVSLSSTYTPIIDGSLDGYVNEHSLTESMDLECFPGSSCSLLLKYKNSSQIALTPEPLVVPLGYIILYNSCNTSINPGKECSVRMSVLKSVQDLEQGTISLNVNGNSLSTDVRLLREQDTIAPNASISVRNGLELEGQIYLLGNQATIDLTLSDNRDISKGLKYTVSGNGICSSTDWISTTTPVHEALVNLIAGQDNQISLKVKDALDNSSDCIVVDIKNLALKSYSVSLIQPLGGGLSTSAASVIYGGSATISYSPPVGREFLSWIGSCSGIGVGNTCLLSNITENKTVGVETQCATGYSLSGNNCVLNTYFVSLTQPSQGTLLSLSGSATVNHGDSRTITYTPLTGYVLSSWTGACSAIGIGNTCVLSNITENKSVGVSLSCAVGYSLSGSNCVLNTYTVSLTQPSQGVLSLSGSATVNHGDSRTITYTPVAGYVLSTWAGSCAGIGSGNTCVLSNITSAKSVSITTTCASGYVLIGGNCVINSYSLTLNQPSVGSLSATSTTTTYGGSFNITYNTSYSSLSAWTGDCAGVGSGNSCVLNGVTSNKTVGASAACNSGLTQSGNTCIYVGGK